MRIKRRSPPLRVDTLFSSTYRKSSIFQVKASFFWPNPAPEAEFRPSRKVKYEKIVRSYEYPSPLPTQKGDTIRLKPRSAPKIIRNTEKQEKIFARKLLLGERSGECGE